MAAAKTKRNRAARSVSGSDGGPRVSGKRDVSVWIRRHAAAANWAALKRMNLRLRKHLVRTPEAAVDSLLCGGFRAGNQNERVGVLQSWFSQRFGEDDDRMMWLGEYGDRLLDGWMGGDDNDALAAAGFSSADAVAGLIRRASSELDEDRMNALVFLISQNESDEDGFAFLDVWDRLDGDDDARNRFLNAVENKGRRLIDDGQKSGLSADWERVIKTLYVTGRRGSLLDLTDALINVKIGGAGLGRMAWRGRPLSVGAACVVHQGDVNENDCVERLCHLLSNSDGLPMITLLTGVSEIGFLRKRITAGAGRFFVGFDEKECSPDPEVSRDPFEAIGSSNPTVLSLSLRMLTRRLLEWRKGVDGPIYQRHCDDLRQNVLMALRSDRLALIPDDCLNACAAASSDLADADAVRVEVERRALRKAAGGGTGAERGESARKI